MHLLNFISWFALLFRPRERWRSIVMSTSHGLGVCVCVCVSVCLSVCPAGYLQNHASDLYQFFCACCLWPWLGPPKTGWRNPKGKGQFWGFCSPLIMHCNTLIANNVVQQNVSFHRYWGWWECTDSAGEVWSTLPCSLTAIKRRKSSELCEALEIFNRN